MNEFLQIIIVNWNGSTDTVQCIESILNSDFTDYKIHLIDNNSTQDQKDIIIQNYKDNSKVQIHLNDENLGFAPAHNKLWNTTLKDQPFEYLCLLNNDTTIDSHCLQNIYSFAKTQESNMISFKMVNHFDKTRVDTVGHFMLTTGEIMPIGHDQNVNAYNQSIQHFGPSGGACLYKKDFIDKYGFFDSYFDTGYEDAEIGLRNLILGGDNTYCPDAIVFHKGGQSIKKVFNDAYIIKTLKNIQYTRYKLLPGILLFFYFPINLLRNLIFLLLSLLLLRWKYFSILIRANFQFYTKGLKKALLERRKYSKDRRISSLNLWRRQTSFIKVDIKRIISIFVRRNQSALDKYR